MKLIKFALLVFLVGIIGGCSAVQVATERLRPSYALQGTSTALVGIALDKGGMPLETVSKVVLKPGHKVVFAGPDRFVISFKNKKAPSGKLKYESNNGVVTITIPKDIFDRSEYRDEVAKNKYIRFDYAINVNGRELDPPMIIQRDD
jgi:hypothetical protein